MTGTFKLNVIRDKVFTSERVVLDGNRYERCEFNNCRLIFNGQKWFCIANGCIYRYSRFVFAAEAAVTLSMMRVINLGSDNFDRAIADSAVAAIVDPTKLAEGVEIELPPGMSQPANLN